VNIFFILPEEQLKRNPTLPIKNFLRKETKRDIYILNMRELTERCIRADHTNLDLEIFQYIQNLDLHYLVRRITNGLKWKVADAEEAVRKYKNFLLLKYLHPDLKAVPTPEIDEAWHAHILHTQEYMQDCERIFGSYLHHRPSSHTQEEQELMGELYSQTLRLYEKMFCESYGHTLNMSEWIQ
jgi:hypothetical protein